MASSDIAKVVTNYTYDLHRAQRTIAPGEFESTIFGVDIIVNYWNPRPGEVYYTFQPAPKKEPAYARVPLTTENLLFLAMLYGYAQLYNGLGTNLGLDGGIDPGLSYFAPYDSCLQWAATASMFALPALIAIIP